MEDHDELMSMDNTGDSVWSESGQNWINQNEMKTEQTRT